MHTFNTFVGNWKILDCYILLQQANPGRIRFSCAGEATPVALANAERVRETVTMTVTAPLDTLAEQTIVTEDLLVLSTQLTTAASKRMSHARAENRAAHPSVPAG